MLQAYLRRMLLAEAILYVWLCLVLGARGIGPVLSALIVLLIALVWRLSHALGSFAFTAILRWRDGRTLPWGSNMAALADEFAARFVCFNWSQAFPGVAVGPDPSGGKGGAPILLVHGYLCNRGVWVTLRRRLTMAGLGPVYTITLEPLFAGIDGLAGKLAARIEAICKETGSPQVMIVAHSMGGMVARAYRVQSGAQNRIAGLATLGTPHHGSHLARWAIGKNARQLRAHSEWIKTLEDLEAVAASGRVPTLSIYSLNDDLVYPPESAVLAWAENVPVAGVGHMGLVFSEPVAKRIIKHLRQAAAPERVRVSTTAPPSA